MRQPKMYIVAGAPGMGKSTMLANMAKKERGNVCVLKHAVNIEDKAFGFLTEKTMSNWRQGAAPTIPVKFKISILDDDEYKEFLNWVLAKNFQNGLLILDDQGMFEQNQSSKIWKRIMIMRRHVQLDIAVVFHGLTQVPIDMFTFANYLILYNTADEFSYKHSKIPNFKTLLKATEQVKQHLSSEKTKYTPVVVPLLGY